MSVFLSHEPSAGLIARLRGFFAVRFEWPMVNCDLLGVPIQRPYRSACDCRAETAGGKVHMHPLGTKV